VLSNGPNACFAASGIAFLTATEVTLEILIDRVLVLDTHVVFQVDQHLHATLARTAAQLALQQQLVQLSAALRARQRPPPGPQGLIAPLNTCLANVGNPQQFVLGNIECAMEFVESVLTCLRLAPQYIVQYEEQARCPVCLVNWTQVG
jgi:hypothetical protein